MGVGSLSIKPSSNELGVYQFAITATDDGIPAMQDLKPVRIFVGSVNVDGNTSGLKYEALTDGLLILRYLFGLTGTALTGNALGASAVRSNSPAVLSYLNGVKSALDVDGNGATEPLTDGLLIMRYMFGLRGGALTNGAIGTRASRVAPAEIEGYLQTLMP